MADISGFVDEVLISVDEWWEEIPDTRSAQGCGRGRRRLYDLEAGVMSSSGLLRCGSQKHRPCAEQKARRNLKRFAERARDFDQVWAVIVPVDDFRSDRVSDRLYRKRQSRRDWSWWIERDDGRVAIFASINVGGRLPPTELTPHSPLLALRLAGVLCALPGIARTYWSRSITVARDHDDATENGDQRQVFDLGVLGDGRFERLCHEAADLAEHLTGTRPHYLEDGTLVQDIIGVSPVLWGTCLRLAKEKQDQAGS